jgi:ankyrin repeat protein
MKTLILPAMIAACLPLFAAVPGGQGPNNGKDWRTDDSWVNTQTRSFDVAADGTPTDVSRLFSARGKVVLREVDSTGNTMLHYAVRDNPDPEVARRLLAIGASPKAANSLGMTPLMTAIRYNTDDLNVDILLQNGADPNARDRKGETPLFYAVNYRPEAVLVRNLIRYGANPSIRNQAGKTALNIAIQRKCDTDVIAALSSTTNPQIDANGDTPLTQAVRQGDAEAIRALSVAGANFNQVNAYGMTPLMVAATCSQSAVVINALLDCGADITWRDRYGRNALDYAVRYNNQIAIGILRNWGRSYRHHHYDEPVFRQVNYPATTITYRQDFHNNAAGISYQQYIPASSYSEYRDPYYDQRWRNNWYVYPSVNILLRGGHHPRVDYGLGFGFSFH